MNAHEWLQHAGGLIRQRGKDRDRPDGERSMGRAVAMFNIATGHTLTVGDGWLFMRLLKIARGNSAADLEDGIAYAALEAEERHGGQG
jgi:hypothetical protein